MQQKLARMRQDGRRAARVSFRGACFAEESRFAGSESGERLLASLGITELNCLAVP
jgi:hypothetical protein